MIKGCVFYSPPDSSSDFALIFSLKVAPILLQFKAFWEVAPIWNCAELKTLNPLETPLTHPWYALETPLKPSRNALETLLKRSWNALEMLLKRSWNTLETPLSLLASNDLNASKLKKKGYKQTHSVTFANFCKLLRTFANFCKLLQTLANFCKLWNFETLELLNIETLQLCKLIKLDQTFSNFFQTFANICKLL